MWSSYKQVYSSVHTHYNLFFDFLLANQNTTNGFLVSFGWLVVRLYVFFFFFFFTLTMVPARDLALQMCFAYCCPNH